jgi:AhpD family alkylhydroperoxidase
MKRIVMKHVQPEAYKAMAALEKYLSMTGLSPVEKELIKIRASQINGCAYCVNMHTRDARKLGETEERLTLIVVWHEASNVFTEQEQLLLKMTEEITLIHRHGLSDETYERAILTFGEEKTAQIIMAIVTINAWNRIGVSTKMLPDVQTSPYGTLMN